MLPGGVGRFPTLEAAGPGPSAFGLMAMAVVAAAGRSGRPRLRALKPGLIRLFFHPE